MVSVEGVQRASGCGGPEMQVSPLSTPFGCAQGPVEMTRLLCGVLFVAGDDVEGAQGRYVAEDAVGHVALSGGGKDGL